MNRNNIFKKYPSSGRKIGGQVVPDVIFKRSKAPWILPQGTILIRIFNDGMDKKNITAVADGNEFVLELGPKGTREGEQVMTESEFETVKTYVGGGDARAGLRRMMDANFKFERLIIHPDDRGSGL